MSQRERRIWKEFGDAHAMLVQIYLSPDAPGLELIEEGSDEGLPAVHVEAGYKVFRMSYQQVDSATVLEVVLSPRRLRDAR